MSGSCSIPTNANVGHIRGRIIIDGLHLKQGRYFDINDDGKSIHLITMGL